MPRSPDADPSDSELPCPLLRDQFPEFQRKGPDTGRKNIFQKNQDVRRFLAAYRAIVITPRKCVWLPVQGREGKLFRRGRRYPAETAFFSRETIAIVSVLQVHLWSDSFVAWPKFPFLIQSVGDLHVQCRNDRIARTTEPPLIGQTYVNSL